MLSQNVVVRPFTEADAGAVAALIRSTLFASNASDYPASELEALADWYGPGPLVSRLGLAERFVAQVGEVIVGTGALHADAIEGFFVSPAWQGRGVGEQILAAIEGAARRGALGHLRLDSSVTAVGFYTRHGFELVGPPTDVGEGLVVPMRKHL